MAPKLLPPSFTVMLTSLTPRIAVRGVAGAHLYEVSVDGEPLAFLEDRQDEPTYLHNSVVSMASEVVVVPLGYGQHRQRGTPSLPQYCPPQL